MCCLIICYSLLEVRGSCPPATRSRNKIVQKKSHFWIFVSQIFSKCLISCHILIIWWKIWVLLTIIFSLKIWLSPSSLTVDVTSMTAKDQLDITQSFLHFFISNFHETSFFIKYFDNLMKNLVFECEKDRYNKI